MSNQVGKLYREVIDGVLKEARLDFEDTGKDVGVLDMLQQEWFKRLDAMHVTGSTSIFGEEESLGVGSDRVGMPPLVGGNFYGMDLADPTGGGAGAALGGPSGVASSSSPRGMPNLFVKDEEVTYPNDATAAMRAAQNIQQYAKDEHLSLPGMPRSVQGLMGRAQNQNIPIQQGMPQQPDVLSSGLRQQLETVMNQGRPGSGQVPQTDGIAADDEEIGSDLDDELDQDELNSENEDEETEQSQIMLCLYDKVQRVKNKWKYTLKDGVANVNGLDYVFNRATGESEW